MINWIKFEVNEIKQYPVLVTWSGYAKLVRSREWFEDNYHLPVTHYAHINLPGEEDKNGHE